MRIVSVELADLDGDKQREAYVSFAEMVGERHEQSSGSLAVFEGNSDCEIRLIDTFHLYNGMTGKVVGGPRFAIRGKQVVGTWMELDPKSDIHHVDVRTAWKLEGDKLREVDRKEERQLIAELVGTPTEASKVADQKPTTANREKAGESKKKRKKKTKAKPKK